MNLPRMASSADGATPHPSMTRTAGLGMDQTTDPADQANDQQNLVELRPSGDSAGTPVSWIRSSLRSGLIWPAALFVSVTVFVAVDMAADLASGIGATHLGIETAALMLCLAGVYATGLELTKAVRSAYGLRRDLDGTRADLAHWQAEAEALLRGVSAAIDQQFRDWELSSAECDVALLILKGLSYKEVAQVRATTERTVRHQALAIYRKAGLAGRAEMAAYFLEDLLLPRQAAAPTGTSTGEISRSG
jgi:DNA-binding CsgD family transcriptional regulator